jgi:NAD(P)-dependent dehydrogenase (short-subunit alcohol dehydrogenase family)
VNLELEGKSVIVTGGARGIGLACAEAFLREGALVAILDHEADLLKLAQDRLAGSGGEVLALRCDVTQASEVEAAHDAVIEAFGGIDVGFNNAGTASRFVPINEMSEEDFDRVVAVNLKGVFLCMRAQVRHMRPRGSGAIVNTASNVSFVGSPGAAAYVATKHGIVGLTRSVALELAGTGIRINAVGPGAIRSEIVRGNGPGSFTDAFPDAMIRRGMPIGRLGEASEVADAVLWLASPRASLALGETLVIDGGFTAQ